MHRRDANERMLSSFLARYGARISNGPIPISPSNRTFFTGLDAAPLVGVQTGHSPHSQTFHHSRTIRPPPYESPTQGTFMDANIATRMRSWSDRSGHVVAGEYGWTRENNGVAGQPDAGQGVLNKEPNSMLRQTNIERPLESTSQVHQEQDEVLPKQKKQASQT